MHAKSFQSLKSLAMFLVQPHGMTLPKCLGLSMRSTQVRQSPHSVRPGFPQGLAFFWDRQRELAALRDHPITDLRAALRGWT